MTRQIDRRRFIQGTAAGGLVAATMNAPFIRSAHAADPLSVVDWGPPWIENTKQIGAAWGKSPITWTLHSGGAASILPKIKASWPNPPYDLIDVWSPVFNSMIREGWAETVTLENCPNMKNIPEGFISKDENGNWKNIPRGSSGIFFTYVPANCPIEINTIEDLLSPKLKGQILWPNPTLNTNLQVIALATARGGDQFNLDPGWEFLEELARSGNIGRVSANTSDVITSLETGETSITFVDQGTLGGIKGAKLRHLTKTHESMKTFMFVSGWVVMSSSKNKELAFDLANYSITKENMELYYQGTGEVPVHVEAQHAIEHLRFSPEEVDKFVVVPDWDHLGTELDGWNKRFEKDIVQLL
jgi:putative spermidine/putrescine transport system substrate-binding protein|tara:strand:+ start:1678 stop:2751 length:1074 start_codon:yes stop_codon:yes gene_type:complete